MEITKIISLLETDFPLVEACEWDNVGWQIKTEKTMISNIVLALDVTNEVILLAIKNQANLIICHHPFIFQQTIAELKTNPWKKELYQKLINNKINVYALHTNFDKSANGLNFLVAKNLKVNSLKYLTPEKLAVSGQYQNLDLIDVVNLVKTYFNYEKVRVVTNNFTTKINQIIISSGAGGSTIHDLSFVKKMPSDVLLVTGELKWHEEIEAIDKNINVIVVGHNMEEKFVDFISDFLISKDIKKEIKINKVFSQKSFFK